MRTEEEYKNIAEELELSNECLDLANDNYAKLNARLAKVEAERDSLHGIVCDCLKSLGNGSGATKECSIEFLSGAPEEIRLVVSEIRADSDALAAQLQEMREAFPQAHRLAMELECLLLSCTDTCATAKWWESANEALQQWREYLHQNEALATPDTSAQILARRDAAVWVEAADWYANGGYACADVEEALRAKADELLKGLEKEHG